MKRDQARSVGKMRTRRSLRSEESHVSSPHVTPPSDGSEPSQPLQESGGAIRGIITPSVVSTDYPIATPSAPQMTIPSSEYGMVVIMSNPQILDNIVEATPYDFGDKASPSHHDQIVEESSQLELGGHNDDEDMEPCDDEQDVTALDEDDSGAVVDEDELRRLQKLDSVSTIASLQLKPHHLSRMKISLCRMVSMSIVRPTLACDIKAMQANFANRYREGVGAFYISITNEQGLTEEVSENDKKEWGVIWEQVNEEFDLWLVSHPKLKHLKNKKLFVCDGNHRLLAWYSHIATKHKNKGKWRVPT